MNENGKIMHQLFNKNAHAYSLNIHRREHSKTILRTTAETRE